MAEINKKDKDIIAAVIQRLVETFSTQTIPADMSGFDLSDMTESTLKLIACGDDPVAHFQLNRLETYLKKTNPAS